MFSFMNKFSFSKEKLYSIILVGKSYFEKIICVFCIAYLYVNLHYFAKNAAKKNTMC